MTMITSNFFLKGQKNPGTKLLAPLETLQRAFNMLKETEPFFGTQNDENYQARKLAGTKIFSFHKKQVPTGIELLGFFVSSMGVTTAPNAQSTPWAYKENNFQKLLIKVKN